MISLLSLPVPIGEGPRYVRVKATARLSARHRYQWPCGCWVEFTGHNPPPNGNLPDDVWELAERQGWTWAAELAACRAHGGIELRGTDRDYGRFEPGWSKIGVV